jgi:hypothetical protein
VAASSLDLTTVAAVAQYIGGIDAGDQATNDLLQALITAASAYASSYCSRDFRSATYSQAYNGTGTQRIMLRVAPVSAVSALSIDGIAIPAATSPLYYGYVFDESGMVYLRGCYGFAEGWQNVQVTYTAGWVTPGQGGSVTLPQDMQQAVIETVALKYKAQRNNIGIAARQIAGETISYSQVDIPKSAQPVFDIYQRVAVVS